MARIIVKLYGELYEAAGRVHTLEIEVKGEPTIIDIARVVEEKLPGLRGRLLEGGKLRDDVLVLVNGRSIDWLEGGMTRVKDGDRVAFFPPAGGG